MSFVVGLSSIKAAFFKSQFKPGITVESLSSRPLLEHLYMKKQ